MTTKVVLAGDSQARPVSRVTFAGYRHDSIAFIQMMAGIRIRSTGPGCLRAIFGHLLGDNVFSNETIRGQLSRHRHYRRADRARSGPAPRELVVHPSAVCFGLRFGTGVTYHAVRAVVCDFVEDGYHGGLRVAEREIGELDKRSASRADERTTMSVVRTGAVSGLPVGAG